MDYKVLAERLAKKLEDQGRRSLYLATYTKFTKYLSVSHRIKLFYMGAWMFRNWSFPLTELAVGTKTERSFIQVSIIECHTFHGYNVRLQNERSGV